VSLPYSEIVNAYEKISSTTSRLEITDILVNLLKKASKENVDKIVYLTQGKLYPDYVGLELGFAEKFMVRALSLATGVNVNKINEELKKKGDIGIIAQEIITQKRQAALFEFIGLNEEKLTVDEVYETLDKVAKITGEGSQDAKIKIISGLLKKATPNEAKYLARTIVGTLRLGLADMTILDAIAIAYLGSKDYRELVERAYNVSSDLGYVAKVALNEGIEGLKKIKVRIGIPVRPMLAERAESVEEIFTRLGPKFIAEYKYDGERVQIHKKGNEFILFSRSLENITNHYPDIIENIKNNLKANEVILEGEIVAVNSLTGEMLPFQELMHRRRKYDVEKAIEEYPTVVYLFDIIYIDGEELIDLPILKRKEFLEKIVVTNDYIRLAVGKLVSNEEEFTKFFNEAVASGCEGLMCKSIKDDSIYKAGSRGFLWIKFKRSYQSKMIEPIDVVVVGGFYGTGRRAGKLGGLLVAVYDDKNDVFKTICKLGSGFTDEDLEKLPKLLEPYKIDHIHPRVVSKIDADVWYVPNFVIEVIGDEITLSPIHTTAQGLISKDSGLAIRFPRFTGRYREDKKPEDATTEEEVIEMYKRQLKKIEIKE